MPGRLFRKSRRGGGIRTRRYTQHSCGLPARQPSVDCCQHARCSRHAAVEHSDGSTVTIASCSTGAEEFPLFTERKRAETEMAVAA